MKNESQILYQLVSVNTKDNLLLHGLLAENLSKEPKSIIINIHGTASNFYEEDFIETFAKELPKTGFSVMFTNNRGAGNYNPHDKTGAAVEKFESCVLDIDAWIGFAIKKGYHNIILSGHSLGSEKIVYYSLKGKYWDKINALILLAPSDSFGYLYKNDKSVKDNLEKAKQLIKENKRGVFLNRYSYSNIMPKSAESFADFLDINSELSMALPFHKGKLEIYNKIMVPILAVIGDKKEYTTIPVKEALNLLKKENSCVEVHQIKKCNHDFEGKKNKLIKIVKKFLDKNFSGF